MAAEDRFRNTNGPNFGLITTPGTRIKTVAHAAFSDTVDLTFCCSYFKASAAGTLTVDTPESTNEPLVVVAGYNVERIKRIYATGSDSITVTICDQGARNAS